jgi:metal-responsive CopG/Arc/MetJ family transcriptional regulator
MKSTKQKRGAVEKTAATLVAVWLPNDVLTALDATVKKEDSDRSKTIRKALRFHLDRRTA